MFKIFWIISGVADFVVTCATLSPSYTLAILRSYIRWINLEIPKCFTVFISYILLKFGFLISHRYWDIWPESRRRF